MNKLIGISLVVIGLGLVCWGYLLSNAVGGGAPDDPGLQYAGGAASIMLGVMRLRTC